MIGNPIYRKALEQAASQVAVQDGSILVTGASGLIGSCIVDLLMLLNEKGHHYEVYALGRNESKLRNRFKAFEDSEHLHFIAQDITLPLDTNLSFDYIIHAASHADPRNYALHPAETMLINVEGAKNVLDYCKAHKSTRVELLSTFEVYGNAHKDVYSEDDFGVLDINKVRSCYPESKRCMEIMGRSYIDEYGVNAVIGRLCSIYGPTMAADDSKAHAQFIRNGLKGEDIVLKSKGEQRRTYCYVIDAVTGILCILAKGKVGEAYNIANENAVVSIAEVAQTVADHVGTKVIMEIPSEMEKKGYSAPQNCILDNSKLKELGWNGNYDIQKGISETIAILS